MSYWTPTQGMGCRSGGYVIFVVIALALFLVEMLVWWLVPQNSMSSEFLRHYEDPLTRFGSNIERRLHRADSNKWTLNARHIVHRMLASWSHLTLRDRIEVLFLRPGEAINAAWLCYIVAAQTFGTYRNCTCMASVWGGRGGYIDFETMWWYRAHGVQYYWGAGTAVSCAIMAISSGYIVLEWCTQSHLSTQDYGKASRGLRRTRAFKKYTAWLRDAPNAMINGVKVLRFKMLGGTVRYGRRSLVWTCHTKQYHGLPPFTPGWELPSTEEDQELLSVGKDGANTTVMHTLRPPSETHSRSPARLSEDTVEHSPARPTSTL